MMPRILVEVTVMEFRQVTAFAAKANKETRLALRCLSRNALCPATGVANPAVLH